MPLHLLISTDAGYFCGVLGRTGRPSIQSNIVLVHDVGVMLRVLCGGMPLPAEAAGKVMMRVRVEDLSHSCGYDLAQHPGS